MHKPQKNTLYNTKCHSKNQAQVFEYCLSEEESDLQSTVAPTPQKTANNSIHTKASWQKAHSRMGSNVTSDSLNDCPLYVQDKENIYDKPRDYYLKNVQTLLNHKANVSPLRPQGIKAINELANQGNNMTKIRPNLEASYASELLSHLDVNIQEFRNLLANNLNKLGPKEKSLFENAQANDDSKVLEISRLTLRLEESKFCTENEPSELKLLKEFETAHSHPTNCSLLERSLDENKAPDLTESIQFDKPWNMTEQRSNYCSGTVQVANTGYTSNHNFFTDGAYRTEEQAQYRSSQGRDRSRSRSPIFLGRKTPCENDTSAFDIFQEDYESMFETFKRIMPDLSSKSHIIRYLKGHDSLGSEFLYAVMLDLKEIEKNVFLMHHQSTTREKYLQDQVNEMGKLSSQNLESPHWKARGEKTTERRDAKSSRGDSGVITMYMRKHYQSLIQKLNNFYGQKLEILKESVQNEEKYAINKDSIEDVAEDLEEELGIEEMQGLLRENLRKVKEVNDLIGEIWKERKDAENVDSENEGRNKQEQGVKSDGMRKLSVDSGSTGFMTTIRCDGFEGRKEDMGVEESYERYRGEEEQETRLNMSEVEMLRVEGLLKEKENEINIIRKKEQMYQNMIFKLTQELKEAKKMNMLNSQEKTSQ